MDDLIHETISYFKKIHPYLYDDQSDPEGIFKDLESLFTGAALTHTKDSYYSFRYAENWNQLSGAWEEFLTSDHYTKNTHGLWDMPISSKWLSHLLIDAAYWTLKESEKPDLETNLQSALSFIQSAMRINPTLSPSDAYFAQRVVHFLLKHIDLTKAYSPEFWESLHSLLSNTKEVPPLDQFVSWNHSRLFLAGGLQGNYSLADVDWPLADIWIFYERLSNHLIDSQSTKVSLESFEYTLNRLVEFRSAEQTLFISSKQFFTDYLPKFKALIKQTDSPELAWDAFIVKLAEPLYAQEKNLWPKADLDNLNELIQEKQMEQDTWVQAMLKRIYDPENSALPFLTFNRILQRYPQAANVYYQRSLHYDTLAQVQDKNFHTFVTERNSDIQKAIDLSKNQLSSNPQAFRTFLDSLALQISWQFAESSDPKSSITQMLSTVEQQKEGLDDNQLKKLQLQIYHQFIDLIFDNDLKEDFQNDFKQAYIFLVDYQNSHPSTMAPEQSIHFWYLARAAEGAEQTPQMRTHLEELHNEHFQALMDAAKHNEAKYKIIFRRIAHEFVQDRSWIKKLSALQALSYANSLLQEGIYNQEEIKHIKSLYKHARSQHDGVNFQSILFVTELIAFHFLGDFSSLEISSEVFSEDTRRAANEEGEQKQLFSYLEFLIKKDLTLDDIQFIFTVIELLKTESRYTIIQSLNKAIEEQAKHHNIDTKNRQQLVDIIHFLIKQNLEASHIETLKSLLKQISKDSGQQAPSQEKTQDLDKEREIEKVLLSLGRLQGQAREDAFQMLEETLFSEKNLKQSVQNDIIKELFTNYWKTLEKLTEISEIQELDKQLERFKQITESILNTNLYSQYLLLKAHAQFLLGQFENFSAFFKQARKQNQRYSVWEESLFKKNSQTLFKLLSQGDQTEDVQQLYEIFHLQKNKSTWIDHYLEIYQPYLEGQTMSYAKASSWYKKNQQEIDAFILSSEAKNDHVQIMATILSPQEVNPACAKVLAQALRLSSQYKKYILRIIRFYRRFSGENSALKEEIRIRWKIFEIDPQSESEFWSRWKLWKMHKDDPDPLSQTMRKKHLANLIKNAQSRANWTEAEEWYYLSYAPDDPKGIEIFTKIQKQLQAYRDLKVSTKVPYNEKLAELMSKNMPTKDAKLITHLNELHEYLNIELNNSQKNEFKVFLKGHYQNLLAKDKQKLDSLALEFFNWCIKEDSEDQEAYEQAAEIYRKQGKLEDACKLALQFFKSHPQESMLLQKIIITKADQHVEQSQITEAVRLYEQALGDKKEIENIQVTSWRQRLQNLYTLRRIQNKFYRDVTLKDYQALSETNIPIPAESELKLLTYWMFQEDISNIYSRGQLIQKFGDKHPLKEQAQRLVFYYQRFLERFNTNLPKDFALSLLKDLQEAYYVSDDLTIFNPHAPLSLPQIFQQIYSRKAFFQRLLGHIHEARKNMVIVNKLSTSLSVDAKQYTGIHPAQFLLNISA